MYQQESTELSSALWVFGYGSLVWRPAFEHDHREPATLAGFVRRFCQASHDHRGTPTHPGRVVTLMPSPGSACRGMAYRIPPLQIDTVLAYLDHREQDGYERLRARLLLDDGRAVDGITWIANPDNPSWRGDESIEEVASLIATREGPSGTNREYLYRLEQALAHNEVLDEHVFDLARRVRQLAGDG